MRKTIFLISFFLLLFSSVNFVLAATNWPKEIPIQSGGKITIYQPQPESLLGPNLKSRFAIAVKKSKDADPIFGVVWSECYLATDRNSRMATLESIKITNVKFPDEQDPAKIDSLKKVIETEILKWDLEISLDELAATLEEQKKSTDDKLNTAAPKIIYSKVNATLVLIDGEPIVKKDDKMNMERVTNTPYLIVKSPEDSKFYLYGEKIWYSATSVMGSYSAVTKLPKSISGINDEIKKQIKENNDTSKAPSKPPAIIFSTVPAELISSDGEPNFQSVEGTGLLYMSNSDKDIFMDVAGQQYYVVLSGRWYKSASMNGPWTFIESDKLPSDFAKIPEGSEKDAVLANVAGTDASKEAIMDAQIPQTAKVDRKTATATVTYDGEPKFEIIEGTKIELAVNTASTVMRANGKYYCVENGVWFASVNATGPWTVSDERPSDVDNIPATSPAYNTKYVYIYDSTPEVVYVGYTPGYVGCYVYGPTVVYGTGFYYVPWYGAYYYPRPVTYGFSMHYNPWTGWSMGFGVNYGMVHVSFHSYGGWYGCPGYHPPYGYHAAYHGGYYGHHNSGNVYVNRSTNININNNNIYNNKNGVSTRDNNYNQANRPSTKPAAGTSDLNKPSTQPAGGNRDAKPSTQPVGGNKDAKPSTQPAGNKGNSGQSGAGTRENTNIAKPATGAANNVYSDKQGNVYQNDKGNWQQRENGNWKSTTPSTNQNVDQMQREQQSRDRANTNYNNGRGSKPAQQAAPAQRSAPSQRAAPSRGGRR